MSSIFNFISVDGNTGNMDNLKRDTEQNNVQKEDDLSALKTEMCILNSTMINEYVYNNKLNIVKKQEKSFCNYYIFPTMGFKIYKARVSWIDSAKRHLSFSFKVSENKSLLTLIKNVNSKLFDYIQRRELLVHEKINPMYYEKGDHFYVKCFLPNTNGKYHIKRIVKDTDNITGMRKDIHEEFTVPLVGCVYDSVDIEIRNMWETTVQSGFHLELKKVYLDFCK